MEKNNDNTDREFSFFIAIRNLSSSKQEKNFNYNWKKEIYSQRPLMRNVECHSVNIFEIVDKHTV